MNRVVLMGRLTRDPEIRYSQNSNDQMAIARFTLAVDRRFRRDGENTADFISCVAFGKTAEFMSKYTHQGTKLCVEGRIQTGSYVKQDGSKVYTTDVVIENAEFAESKAAEAGRSAAMPQGQNQYGAQNQRQWQGQSYQQQPAAGGQAPVNAGQAQFANDPQSFMNPPVSEEQEGSTEGFMSIPDAVDDEGLPFG